ncbi:MAG: aldehyde dehydrogenase [Candidatus Tectimicrobiota bacterium]|nr:MAG: aldehyde dehydrogenase [Candidatus Tectomicrobia bacterium]
MAVLPKMIGERIKRREDPALIQGLGHYVDDIPMVGTLHAAFYRSPYAHARIKSINVEAAKRHPGVVAVLTGADILGKVGTIPCGAATPGMKLPTNHALAVGKVGFVGQPVAVVVADNPYTAQDAADLIEMDVELLPAVVDPEQAAQPGAPKVHEEFEDNIMFRVYGPAPEPSPTPLGLTDEWFRQADKVVSLKITQQRLVPMPMEPRGVLATYDRGRRRLTVWISTQIPHLVRTLLAGALRMPEHHIHVIAPDVGGGFGCKIQLYPEELLIPYLARELGRPVKWIERRREHFTSTIHGRGLVEYFDAAVKNDGTLLAIKCRAYCDMGAYMQLLTPAIPSLGLILMSGAYDCKAFEYEQIAVFTNKVATDAYRGAGRPEAAYAIERLMDAIARELNMDPVEVRRKNFKRDFTQPTPAGLIYDSGNYEAALNKALEIVGYEELRAEQKRLREQGRYLGIGISSYIEICGIGPSYLLPPGVGGWESCTVRVEPTGMVTVLTGVSPHGQGSVTSFAQIVADELGVPVDNVEVIHGDTDVVPYGIGTFGSRSLAVGGAALLMSVNKVKEKAKRIAAHLLDVRPEDVTYGKGEIYVTSEPSRKVTFDQVAFAAADFSWQGPGSAPPDLEPGLEATSRFEPGNATFPFGTHVCVVEVDRETGQVEIKRYVAVDDCGNIINPLLVAGQVHGGIAQGLAQALYEQVVYDDNGQLITGSLMDYAVPKAAMVPTLETDHTITPTPVNPLGAKGVGEAGTIGSTPAVANAIIDALAPFGVKHLEMPFTPEKLWRAMNP